ncbi:MAG: hypothetical protein GXX91_05420 [Verrucomicrobiaceae bacterium]|nr:hypothetical protein [Verrucomicrobiaceae bacterium]
MTFRAFLFFPLLAGLLFSSPKSEAGEAWSGIYPHLAFFNDESECGTGAVVPWAGRLWALTYAPHKPRGSSDKLYEITPELELIIRPESIGGTPANRMIHRESEQLFMGPYAIDKNGLVRVIPYSEMFGRPTANARHLTDPAGKIYLASMEEALYEIDVESLAVTTLYRDEQDKTPGPKSDLPGYHGKGMYSGQGVLVYANNGENSSEARRDPFVESGVLAQWDGADWHVVRRSQFTEVTGPGGIYGNPNPATDPLWSIGWDAKSLLLMLLDGGEWHAYRLPKTSHSYDGAHGWNTEWPRIREIGEGDELLMTMHGMFWKFPKTFSLANTAGISPRSSYLKVIGDFCQWQGRLVFGCDDTAKSEFLNKRKAKGEIAGPQSQSNLWFVEPDQLDHFGPVLGRGAVWLNEAVAAGTASDPYLFGGLRQRALHLAQTGADEASVTLEIDREGTGTWEPLQTVVIPPRGYLWTSFADTVPGVWIRLVPGSAVEGLTAAFTNGDGDGDGGSAPVEKPGKFTGLIAAATDSTAPDARPSGGVIRARSGNKRTLHFAARNKEGSLGLYTLNETLTLSPDDNATELAWLEENAAIPSREGVLQGDAASVLYLDDSGRRYRLPRGGTAYDHGGPLGGERLCREVATERDLFNCHGTFFELPAENAGGFSRVRPVATHGLRIVDYCSYRGLLVIAGVDLAAAGENRHVIRSTDGKTGLWVGAIDDLWDLGKPVGSGGPWLDTAVQAGEPSDPYLMTGYDRKELRLSAEIATTITVEVDLTGMDDWVVYRTFELAAGAEETHLFPDGFQAYWVRCRAADDTVASAQLDYR